MDNLPDDYDLIVVGTGMPECIIAAAAARIGKSVLHLDRNEYYGGKWANFNLELLNRWISDKQRSCSDGICQRFLEANWLEQLNDSENLVLCPRNVPDVLEIMQKTYVRESLPEVISEDNNQSVTVEQNYNLQADTNSLQQRPSADSASEERGGSGEPLDTMEESLPSDSHPEEVSVSVVPPEEVSVSVVPPEEVSVAVVPPEEVSVSVVPPEEVSVLVVPLEEVSAESPEQVSESAELPEQVSASAELPEQVSASAELPEQVSASAALSEQVSPSAELSQQNLSNAEDNGQPDGSSSSSNQNTATSNPVPEQRHIWTMEELMSNRHKFNIDLSPKLLFSRGALVELLISSNTARYAEFQSVSRILTHINGHLEQVPCSRADVFSTKNVSVVEKRMLMKLLTFCLEYQNHPDEYRGFEGRLFVDFLRSRKITPNIEHYILHAIAMVDESCLTLQGLKATQKFMESLGRFGNSPFLCTCYGSGELPQCFCRLCAVFGGIYYLGRDIDAVILDDSKCAGVISQGKKLKCRDLVMEYNYLPQQYLPEEPSQIISHAIYITDSSLMSSERKQNTLLRLSPVSGVCNTTTVLEFGSLSYVCPNDLFVVYMICRPFADTVEQDFHSVVEELFMPLVEEIDITENATNEENRKPKVLWSLHFKQIDTTGLDLASRLPAGVHATSSPGLDLDYDHAVMEAHDIFERMYPGEEFLPRAPDPEDIVIEGHSNPGDEENSDDHENDPEKEVITNDVSVEEATEVECFNDECKHAPEHTKAENIETGVEVTEDTV